MEKSTRSNDKMDKYYEDKFDLPLKDKMMFFPKMDSKDLKNIEFNRVSVYSTTDQISSRAMAEQIKLLFDKPISIMDACACIGGNTLGFIEILDIDTLMINEYSPYTFKLLKSNVDIYKKYSKKGDLKIVVKNENFLDLLDIENDVLFLDPPFGDQTLAGHHFINESGEKTSVCSILKYCLFNNKLVVLKFSKNVQEKELNNVEPLKKYVHVIHVIDKLKHIKFKLAFMSTNDDIGKNFSKLAKVIYNSNLFVQSIMKSNNIKYR